MLTGERDTKVVIEQKSATQDATFGSEVITWVEFSTQWAQLTDDVSFERLARGVRVAVRGVIVETLWLAGVTTDMRIRLVESGRLLQITSVSERPRKSGLMMMCEEYSSG